MSSLYDRSPITTFSSLGSANLLFHPEDRAATLKEKFSKKQQSDQSLDLSLAKDKLAYLKGYINYILDNPAQFTDKAKIHYLERGFIILRNDFNKNVNACNVSLLDRNVVKINKKFRFGIFILNAIKNIPESPNSTHISDTLLDQIFKSNFKIQNLEKFILRYSLNPQDSKAPLITQLKKNYNVPLSLMLLRKKLEAHCSTGDFKAIKSHFDVLHPKLYQRSHIEEALSLFNSFNQKLQLHHISLEGLKETQKKLILLDLASWIEEMPDERRPVAEKILSVFDDHVTEFALDFLSYPVNELPTCIGQLTQLKTISVINAKFFPEMNKLNLASIAIPAAPTWNDKWPLLKLLDLSCNRLKLISPAIARCNHLEELYLCNNEFEELPYPLSQCVSLKALDLSGNRITLLPNTLLKEPHGEADQLTALSSSSSASTFSKDVFFPELIDLTLAANGLTEFPGWICQLPILKFLDLSQNKLKELSKSFHYYASLVYLNLESNLFEKIPEVLYTMTHLSILYLNKNKLTSLPPSIGNLTNLKYLHLSHNEITSLPDSIALLTKLSSFHLKHTRVEELNPNLGACIALEDFNISADSDLNALPESFYNLTLSVFPANDTVDDLETSDKRLLSFKTQWILNRELGGSSYLFLPHR